MALEMRFDKNEETLVKRGLSRLRRDLQRAIRKQDAEGWAPPPGKRDANRFNLMKIEKMLKRMGVYE